MKNFLFLSLLFLLGEQAYQLYAQTPQLINYQAVARNASGQTLMNQAVSVRLSVRQTTAGGTIQYQETHNLTTTAQGLINLQIGGGFPNLDTFADISWTDGQPKFLQVELDPDGAGAQPFANMGTQQLVSVPYALYGEETRWVKVSGENTKVGNSGFALTGFNNTSTGFNALHSNTIGYDNTANGGFALHSNTTGYQNTANGTQALYSNTEGNNNTANGYAALYYNTTGYENNANGSQTLYYNTTGYSNNANGISALYSNTTGYENNANGNAALYSNTTGYRNTADGSFALYSNTEGYNNTANGYTALYSNTTGYYNTANGHQALRFNSTGSSNTAVGMWALYDNTTTSNNTAIGYSAGDYSTGAANCTMIGFEAGINANNFTNSTALGYQAPITGNNQINVGNTAITSIKGQVGFTTYSDQRFKTNVQPNVAGLDFIMQLRPVTYRLDAEGIDAFLRKGYTPRQPDEDSERLHREGLKKKSSVTYTGFLAQEVEAAAKNTGFDFSGVDKPQNERDLYGLRYAEFVVPLVKAVQEQQEMIEKQNNTIEQLQQKAAEVDALKAELQQIKSLLLQNK